VRRLSAALVFVALVSARAEWRVENSRDENSGPIVHRHVDLANDATGENAIVDLALFQSKACRLRVIDNASRADDLAGAMRRTNCIAGVNGAYFDVDFAPLGLRIINGKTTSPLKHGRLMSGVLASNGAVQILRTNEFTARRKFNSAVQCGPFLVDLAKPVRGLEATRDARRTFAAIAPDRAALGVCSEVTLAEAAKVLSVPLGDFKIQRALNFDGGSSTAFWFQRANGSAFSIGEQKTVRDFIGVTAR